MKARLTESDVGKFFISDGEVYRLAWYIGEPSVAFENVATSEKTCAVGITGLIAQSFTRLVPKED